MPKKASTFVSLTDVTSLKVVYKGNAWMGAIELIGGTTCVVNPVMGLQEVLTGELPVSHVLAPNHYHNKALTAFSEYFNSAQLCSSDAARPRLEKITGLITEPLIHLSSHLPKGMTLIEPEGLKPGEVWLRFLVGDKVGWMVIDAFCGSKMTASKQFCEDPELLKTFPTYGIADRDRYKMWVLEQIKQDQPVLIIPCHGSIIRDSALASKLEALIATL